MASWIYFLYLQYMLSSLPAFSEVDYRIKHAYIDVKNQVHIVLARNKNITFPNQSNPFSLTVSPDRRSVAWLVQSRYAYQAPEMTLANEVRIYRNGKLATIDCEMFVREYWFWKQGKYIAIDCGPPRFSGREELYEVATLKLISSFDQEKLEFEKRPDWSKEDR